MSTAIEVSGVCSTQAWGTIETRYDLNATLFNEYYLRRGIPVIVKNYLRNIEGVDNWGFGYLQEKLSGMNLPLKRFMSDGRIEVEHQAANEYIASLLLYEQNRHLAGDTLDKPAYCHDIPLFCMAEHLINDVRSIPAGLFPSWYQSAWWRYAQFFMSCTGSCTPLHFDTLLTHNLFFQVKGQKEFVLLPFSESKRCYRRDWRWFDVDPLAVDYATYPEYQESSATRVIVEAGDLLFMPAGTLHHVVTREASISFNVDFHTKSSVLKSFAAMPMGMPAKNVFYNFLVFLGIFGQIPEKQLFRYYRSYLNYIS